MVFRQFWPGKEGFVDATLDDAAEHFVRHEIAHGGTHAFLHLLLEVAFGRRKLVASNDGGHFYFPKD